MNCGFIGLGEQGGAMAKMMLRAGIATAVWARRPDATGPFVEEGATVFSSAAELASRSDLLSVCVTSDSDVREVVYEGGVLNAMTKGSMLAIHSTVMPSLSEELADRAGRKGVKVLDAPVSGSARAAYNRTLLMMIGGDRDAFEKSRPIFASYANPIMHIGPVGTAMRTKLINNLVAAAQKGIAVRALRAAREQGIDPTLVQAAILAGVGRSAALEIVGRLQAPERARHIGPLITKDMELARKALGSKGLEPLFELAAEAVEWIRKWGEDTEQILAAPAAV